MPALSIYRGLDELPASYQMLLEDAQTHGFSLGLPWYRNFVQTVHETDDELHIYGLSDAQGQAQAVLPMWSHGKGRGVFGPRHLEALQNYYAPLYAPALRAGAEFESMIAWAQALKSGKTWDVIDLKPLARDETLFTHTLDALKQAGFAVQPYFCFGNWYLQVAGRSFDTYYANLPSQLKNTVKRKTKQFEAQAGNRIDLVTSAEGLEAAITAYQTVYTASWKIPEPHPDFMPGLMRTCAAQGWLRMGVAYVDGKPAAAQLWIVCAGVASIFKLAYDEQYAKLSVGSLLTTRLMRHALDVDKVHTVDYLCGDDAYKRDWMSHRRERWGIMAFNPRTLAGLLAAARHLGGHAVKSWLKKLRKKSLTATTAYG